MTKKAIDRSTRSLMRWYFKSVRKAYYYKRCIDKGYADEYSYTLWRDRRDFSRYELERRGVLPKRV